MTVVMRHTNKWRGHLADSFAPNDETDPIYELGRIKRSRYWNHERPIANVEVCRDCDFTRGKQCKACASVRARHRSTDNQEKRAE